MTRTTVKRTIKARARNVFAVIAHSENFVKAVPHILRTEFLSKTKSGVGTRFRETRLVRGKEATTVLEVTEYIENERVRIISDVGGTIWDTVFSLQANGKQTELTMVMDARAYKWPARIMNPLIKGMIKGFIEKDMDAVKAYCEK